jgi:glycosyltransferase involved in cell wall biosynthesis
MRLAITIPYLKAGGSERVASELANFAVKKGLEVDMLLMADEEVFFDLDPKIRVFTPSFPKKNRFLYYLRVILYLRKTLKQTRPDAVLVLGYNVIPALAAISVNTKLVGTHRTSPENDWQPLRGRTILHRLFGLLYRKSQKWAFLRYDKVVFQSLHAKQVLSPIYRKDYKPRIIPNFLREIKDYPVSRRRQIVCVGRLSVEKGQNYLVEAFSRLSDPNWQLVLVGDGPRRKQLEAQAERLGVGDRVVFAGFQKEVDRFLQESEIFVLPSLIEGFPNALLEAMANGLACISFDCPTGPSLLIDHGVNGYLVEMKNVAELHRRLEELTGDEALRKRMASNAGQLRETYHIEKVGQEYLDFILS